MKTFVEKRKGNRRSRPETYTDRRIPSIVSARKQLIFGMIHKGLLKRYDVK